MEHRKFHQNMRKNVFALRVEEHWQRLPREAVESPSLERFQAHLDAFLCKLMSVTLLWKGGWTGWSLKVPSKPHHSLVFCICDSFIWTGWMDGPRPVV